MEARFGIEAVGPAMVDFSRKRKGGLSLEGRDAEIYDWKTSKKVCGSSTRSGEDQENVSPSGCGEVNNNNNNNKHSYVHSMDTPATTTEAEVAALAAGASATSVVGMDSPSSNRSVFSKSQEQEQQQQELKDQQQQQMRIHMQQQMEMEIQGAVVSPGSFCEIQKTEASLPVDDAQPMKRPLVLSDYYSFQRPLYELMPDSNDSLCKSKIDSGCRSSSGLNGIHNQSASGGVTLEQAMDMEVENITTEPTQQDSTCPKCRQLFGEGGLVTPKPCSFCLKQYCSEQCLSACGRCTDVFCTNCSTPNYSHMPGNILCLECSYAL